jgi:hypothetical protein
VVLLPFGLDIERPRGGLFDYKAQFALGGMSLRLTMYRLANANIAKARAAFLTMPR